MPMPKYNKIAVPGDATPAQSAVIAAANTAARPGPLTTEWWTVLVAGGISAIMGAVGLPGPTATQVAAIAAPIVIALVYAVVRAQTKGALADALKGLFPQASAPAANGAAAAPNAAAGNGAQPANGAEQVPAYQYLAVVSPPNH